MNKNNLTATKETMGTRLRAKRDSLKLSQEQMAEILGIERKSVNRYENGFDVPSSILKKYATYFEESSDYFLFGQSQSSSELVTKMKVEIENILKKY